MRKVVHLSYEIEVSPKVNESHSSNEKIAEHVAVRVPGGLGYGPNLFWYLDADTITVIVRDPVKE